MVGATAGSLSITLAVVLTAAVAKALLLSLSVKVVVTEVLATPSTGVNDKRVEFAGDRRRSPGERVAAVRAGEARSAQRSVGRGECDRQRVRVHPGVVGVADRHRREGVDRGFRGRRLAGLGTRDRRGDRGIAVDYAGFALTVGVAKALLLSLSVKVVITEVFGTPTAGLKDSASSSLVIAAAVPLSV